MQFQLDDALALLEELCQIEGPSCAEHDVSQFVQDRLRQAGASTDSLRVDSAHLRTPQHGTTGNLSLRLEGTENSPRRMLIAHLDTVPVCVGSRPAQVDGQLISSDPATGLGADNRAGSAVVLYTALQILRHRLPHPPLTFLWTVQEEIGLQGIRQAELEYLGQPAMAFNWDGGAATKLTIGATGGYRLQVTIHGQASHAGGAPEEGISAITIAAIAIAQLQRDGWHGLIQKEGKQGTANIGIIAGGDATNVVPDMVRLHAEARSHDPEFRQQIVQQIEAAFRDAAAMVTNVAGQTGSVEFAGRLDYESYCLPTESDCIETAQAALRHFGQTPTLAVANGGLDANWTNAYGIPTVSIGCGQLHQHTINDSLEIKQFELACQLALCLATGREKATK